MDFIIMAIVNDLSLLGEQKSALLVERNHFDWSLKALSLLSASASFCLYSSVFWSRNRKAFGFL